MTGFRVAAFAIATLAVVDPAVTSERGIRPLVAVVGGDRGGRALADDVSRSLDRRFTVIRGPSDAASATILIGSAAPDEAQVLHAPLFAVLPRTIRPEARIISIGTPGSALLNARVPVEVKISVHGARGRSVDVGLFAGEMLVDRSSVPVSSDSGVVNVRLSFVGGTGPQLLRARVQITGDAGAREVPAQGRASDSAFTVIDVRDERYAVLFFDLRPSWSSTFVRRALEQDPRFSVTHRVLTSRGLSNTGGDAPASLRDPDLLRDFATIVVGAPEQLTDADVRGLEAYMRGRGGRVVLLMDGRSAGAVDRLTGASGWRGARLAAPSSIRDSAARANLRGRELMWPSVLPRGAVTRATSPVRDSTSRAIIWSVPIGAGRMMVSGAVDAWHFRDDSSGFDSFWTTAIADACARSALPIEIRLSQNVLAPGRATDVQVTVREPFLSDRNIRGARVSATLASQTDSGPVRLWPDRTPGVFEGRIVAPRQPGVYRLVVVAGSDRMDVPVIVDSATTATGRDDPQIVGAFVSSRGGSVFDERDLSQLPARLRSAIRIVPRVETWYPMRSAWWIVPFALLLGVEWWARRRRGQA